MITLLAALFASAQAETPAPEQAPAPDASSGEGAGETPSTTGESPAAGAPAQPDGGPPADPRDAVFGAPSDPRDAVFGAPSDPRDAVFGGDPAAPPADVERTGDRDADVLSGAEGSRERAMLSTLEELDKRLTIGGRLYLRANTSIPEEGDLAEAGFTNPNFLDLFADARPTDRIRGYVQGRLRHDLTVQEGDTNFLGDPAEPTSVTLDQLWLNFDIGRRVFVTAGRQRVKWGAGRFWNPTDFLQPARLDPLAFFDERTGVGLVKVHVPFEKTGTNVYAFADIEGADTFEQVGGAFRVEQIVGLTELALSAYVGKDRPTRLGAQFSTGIWLFDLKAEAALTNGLDTTLYRGDFDWGPLDENGAANLFTLVTPESYTREDEWIPQVVAAIEIPIQYNDEDALYIGAEYFYNDLGYDDASLYPWLLFNDAYTPFYVGKHYAGAYVALIGPGELDDHTFTASTIGNLSDRSFTSRVDYSVRVLTLLQLNAFAGVHYGDYGELRFALDIPPIAGVTEEGTSVAAPLVDLGIGAQISF